LKWTIHKKNVDQKKACSNLLKCVKHVKWMGN
jgi:hypothetical protein